MLFVQNVKSNLKSSYVQKVFRSVGKYVIENNFEATSGSLAKLHWGRPASTHSESILHLWAGAIACVS